MELKILLGIVFGLLVGDYLLQPKLMAIQKSELTKEGFNTCLFHCIIFTLATMSFLYNEPFALLNCFFAVIHWNRNKSIQTETKKPFYVGWICVVSLIIIGFTYFPCAWNTLIVAGVVFHSHWFIDRYSLAGKWLNMIKGRDFISEYLGLKNKTLTEEIVTIPFACSVYIIVDNALHIMILYFALKYLHNIWGII